MLPTFQISFHFNGFPRTAAKQALFGRRSRMNAGIIGRQVGIAREWNVPRATPGKERMNVCHYAMLPCCHAVAGHTYVHGPKTPKLRSLSATHSLSHYYDVTSQPPFRTRVSYARSFVRLLLLCCDNTTSPFRQAAVGLAVGDGCCGGAAPVHALRRMETKTTSRGVRARSGCTARDGLSGTFCCWR